MKGCTVDTETHQQQIKSDCQKQRLKGVWRMLRLANSKLKMISKFRLFSKIEPKPKCLVGEL